MRGTARLVRHGARGGGGITAIIFKDSPEWRAAHAEVKAVLATRKHVPSKAERTEARREAARAAQGSAGKRRVAAFLLMGWD